MAEDPEPEVTEEDEADFAAWWANVPDFLKPGYPLDIPPARMPFARFAFTHAGAAETCPEARCRRARACEGGAGPPCYRAARTDLQQVLFVRWATLFLDVTEAEYGKALRARRNRFAPEAAVVVRPRAKKPRVRRKRPLSPRAGRGRVAKRPR